VGQVLVMLGLGGLTFAIIEAPRAGWLSMQTGVALVVALAAVVALVRYEPRRPEPLLDLRFFRSVPFSGATLIAVCAFGGYSGFLFLTSLYLQDVRGLSPMLAGCCLLPLAAMTLVCAPLSGRIVAARGPRLPLILAGVLLTAGALLLVPTSAHEPFPLLIGCFLVYAAGFGLVNAPITNTAVSGMPRAQAGVAAAVASTSRQVGATLGVAVVGSVLASGITGGLSGGFVPASHAAWWVIVAANAALLVLGALTTGRRAVRTAEKTAGLLSEEPVLVR
jgi:predicted MFS family arabinose efflux permease